MLYLNESFLLMDGAFVLNVAMFCKKKALLAKFISRWDQRVNLITRCKPLDNAFYIVVDRYNGSSKNYIRSSFVVKYISSD